MIGKKLSDRYEILSELGRGGMGVVYRAHDPVLDREVAIKLIAPELLTPDAEKRFQSEAQVVARMDHPAIVSIHDFGRHEGSLFFVMPVLEGQSLRHCLRDQGLTLGQVLDVGIQIAEGLAYSHERGVVHRDIKPENVMVSDESGGLRVRVMDFGLARSHNVTRMTKTGMLVGTMSYISPEQVTGKAVDARADIYALGTVLFEMVAGTVPFTGELQSVLYRIVHELPQPPRNLGAEIGDELEATILDCLAKDPAKRPKDAGKVAQALRHYQGGLRDDDRNRSVLLTRSIQLPRPALSPFVGREEELGELQRRLNEAVTGKCQFVAVAGEAGVGKTRLLDELERLCVAREIRVLHGRCLEQDGSFPYLGFCQVIQEYFEQRDVISNPGAQPDLADVAPDLIALFPMLSEIEPIRNAALGGSQLAAVGESRSAEHRTQIFELLARTLTRLAGGRPLVLLLEELHGAEVSIEALQYIVRRLGPTPTLVVGTYRSTEVDRRHGLTRMLASFRGDRQFAAVALGALSAEEHRQFLTTIVGGGSRVGDALARNLYEASEGNPFFTKELVRSMLDSGSLVQDDTGAWSLSGGAAISSDALPATIQQAVEERVGRLPEDLREILSVAAVMGRSFEFDDLAKLAEDVDDLESAVDRLVQEGLIEEDRQSRGDRLTFTSNVVREVLYSELSRRRRRSLHRQYARLLEKRHDGRLEGIYSQLLHHYYEADEPEKSVEFGLRQARQSLEAFGPDEAIRSSRMALEFLDKEWEGERAVEGDARMLLAAAHRLAGDVPSAQREFGQAAEIFEREGAGGRAIEALLAAAKSAWQVRQAEETGHWVDRGIRAARAAGETDRLAQFLTLAATVANLRGEYGPAREYLAEAERLGEGSRAAPAEAIPEGGRLVVALANPLPAPTPVDMQLNEEFEVWSNVYETLLTTDAEGNLHPLLCASWQPRDEGRAFRFTLRDDLRFQDGHPVTAEDIKRSFEHAIRGLTSDMPTGFSAIRGLQDFSAGRAEELAGVVVVEPHVLEVRLDEPLPIYPALLTDPRTAIVRPHDGGVLGTGPFCIETRSTERVVLGRNAGYWKGTRPRVESIEFLAGLSAASIAQRLRAGEVDLARDLLPEDLDEILRERRFQAGLVEAPQKFTYFVLFNVGDGPVTREPRVREAVAGAVRARDLVWQSLGRFAMPAVGLIPPGVLGHDAGRRPHVRSATEISDLLTAAGHSNGVDLRAAVHPLIQDRYGSLLQAMLAGWAEQGIRVELTTPDTDSYMRAWHDNAGLDMLILRWQPDVDDPDSATHSLFHSEDGQLRRWFSSPETDEILVAARRESRPDLREEAYRRFETLLHERQVLVPLFHDIGYRIAGPRVRGVKLGSTQPYVNYAELGKAETTRPAEIVRETSGVVRVPMTGVVHELDPMVVTVAEQVEVLASIYETLLRDVGDARIEPWLAESFKVEEGGRRYRFRLRDDVLFHDGRRLTVRDVRHSIERLLQTPQSEGRWLYAPIQGARELLEGRGRDLSGLRIHSAREFSLELVQPVSFFPVLLASHHLPIIPEGAGRGEGSTPVGTGPFRVARAETGRVLELERHRDYWRKGLPRSERLVFEFGVAPDRILADFKAGRYSLAADLYPDVVEELRRDPRFGAGYREMPGLSTYFVILNARRGALRDRDTRRSIARGLEAGRLVKQTLGRLAAPAHGLIPPGLIGLEAARADRGRGGEARRAGEPLELTAAVHPIFKAEYSRFYDELIRAFERMDIKIRPVGETMDDYIEVGNKAEVDMVVARWIADYPDAHTFAHILESGDGFVGRYGGSPELDRLVAAGGTELDPSARHAIYREIEQSVAREALLVPLFHEQVYRFVRPEVEGVALSYWAPSVNYAELRIR